MNVFASSGLVAVIAVVGAWACSSPEPAREAAVDSSAAGPAIGDAAAPWYERTRTLDLTGDGEADSVRLVATGERTDSVRIALVFLVDGEERHREEWESSYELALVDSAVRRSGRADSALRVELDAVLASIELERLGTPGVRLMAEDSAILDELEPRPTHRVSFSYGYESTTNLAWDAPRRRFVRLWSCC